MTSPLGHPLLPALLRRNGERLGRWGPDPEASEHSTEEMEDEERSRVWTDWEVGLPIEDIDALGA